MAKPTVDPLDGPGLFLVHRGDVQVSLAHPALLAGRQNTPIACRSGAHTTTSRRLMSFDGQDR